MEFAPKLISFKIEFNGLLVGDNEDDGFSQNFRVLNNQINLQEVKESVIWLAFKV